MVLNGFERFVIPNHPQAVLAYFTTSNLADARRARAHRPTHETMTILPASARFVVPASAAAASKLVLFDVMDTIVADPFFRGFHKVTRTPATLEASGWKR